MKIAVAGLGYVGLSNAVLLAQHNQVVGIDVSPATQALLIGALLKPWHADVLPAQWAQALGMHALPSAEPGACCWQIWRYDPHISPDATTVDPLSLVLSLRDEQDERVQQALAEFEKGLP